MKAIAHKKQRSTQRKPVPALRSSAPAPHRMNHFDPPSAVSDNTADQAVQPAPSKEIQRDYPDRARGRMQDFSSVPVYPTYSHSYPAKSTVYDPVDGHPKGADGVLPPANQSSGPFPEKVSKAMNTGGRSLELPLLYFMEKRFGQDFSAVRLYTGSLAADVAQEVGGLAFTMRKNIFFSSNGYAPHTLPGLNLIAHELTHVLQQGNSPIRHGEKMAFDPENAAAETEAKSMAASVLTPGPVHHAVSVRSTSFHRSTGWAVLGGVIGGLAGGLLGAFAGPGGAILGALGGAALGAWIAGSLSNDKKDDKQGSARTRIHRLLTRSAGDWVVTDAEAVQALIILLEVEKKDPVELFDIVMMMKMNGEWDTLKKELPEKEQITLAYFEFCNLHPDRGYIMPNDRIHLEFYLPGQPVRTKGNETDTQPRKKSIEEFLSMDYDVGSKGISFPAGRDFPQGEIPVVGKSLQDAADIIASALTDPLRAYEMGVELTPVKRGYHYTAPSEVSSPETARGGSVTKDKQALEKRDKRRKFTELVPFELATASNRMWIAVNLYYDEVEKNLDKHDDPQALWIWAREQADKRIVELEKKTPQEKFLEFGRTMIARINTMPQNEQARTTETYSRYIAWLSKHEKDPRLAAYTPVKVWVNAYMNIVEEEVEKSTRAAMESLREKRRDAAWPKAEVKLGEVIEFAKANIWPSTPTEYIESQEEVISEESGQTVKKGWLIMASPAEKIIRDKIASDFLHSMIERMSADPEEFIKTPVKTDFFNYLKSNPEQVEALALTTSHPYVERHENEVDIPTWHTATEVVVGLIPFVGAGVAVYEIYEGRDLFGHPLSTTDRTILGVGLLLPGIFKAVKAGKGAFKASRVVKEFGLSGDEAERVFRMYMNLGPGTKGAKLFSKGLDEIKAGRSVDDPKVLKEMEEVLKDLGMTEKSTAKALMPAVDRQAQVVAAEEVQQVKAIIGPITEETETLLKNNPELREALRRNSLAATILKKCNTPCIPEQATAEQVKRLENILEKIKKTGAYNEEGLRTYLYNRRAELDKAIADLNVFTGTSRLQSGNAAKDMNAWVEFINSGGVVTKGVDPALVLAHKNLAHDLGVDGGRIQAGVEGMTLSGFDPGIKTGSHGQGIDDIALLGKDWDKDHIYILEHKGGEGKLSAGQMELDWVVGNIQRLYREGGAEGKKWAQRLAKALLEGRLRGRAYSTTVVNNKIGATKVIRDWVYKAMKVSLTP